MKRNFVLAAALLFSIMICSTSHATEISYDQVLWQGWDSTLDPNSLSAKVEIEEISNSTSSFLLKLTNTSTLSTPSDYPASVLLTGIGLNLGSGLDITGGIVRQTNLVGPGTASDFWGYDNTPTRGYFQTPPGGVTTKYVDTAVSTMTAAVETIFTSPPPGTIGTYIDGPAYGVASESYLASSYGIPPYPYFAGWIEIEIWLNTSYGNWSEFLSGIDSRDVVVAFGSPTAPVPEPATMLLLGSGLVGLAGFGRRKLFK
jgi:hypothetical protein